MTGTYGGEFDRSRLAADLRLAEGLRLKPYRCTQGRLTIGYGRNLEDRGITTHEALFMLANDIQTCTDELFRLFSWARDVGDVRCRVLVECLFVLGLPRFLGFKRFLAAAQAGDWAGAARELEDSEWQTQAPARVRRLAAMIATGADAAGSVPVAAAPHSP